MGNGNNARVTGCDVKLGLNSAYHNHHCLQPSAAGGVMGASGKVLFTANQWEELERQKKIFLYIMASIPVPPQLLSALSVHSNRLSTPLRFSNGSDPEPWRCRRTDGKKWRCSKDVAPDQKYCERHVHKTRSRSRKPVETQSQNLTVSTSTQQTRFMKKCSIPLSPSTNNQFQLPVQSTSGGSKDHMQSQNSYLNVNSNDWSRIGGGDECSLSLSMQSGGNVVEFDDESFQMAVGMLRGDRDVFKPQNQWVDQGSWSGSGVAPGGPLGEALCLGMGGGQSDLYSQGYSYSTTTSSSCEGGGSHGVDFDFVNRGDD